MDPTFTPSLFLPPLAKLFGHPPALISVTLEKLERIYFPMQSLIFPSLAESSSRKFKRVEALVPDSGYASANDEEDMDLNNPPRILANEQLEIIRHDSIERQLVIKWLTGFIARSDGWVGRNDSPSIQADLEGIVEKSATLLSSFAGNKEEAEAVLRSFTFPTTCKAVSLELNDAPLSSVDHTAVGLQSWGSSILLAARMCKVPNHFIPRSGSAIRLLELGAGTGMLSIVASQLYPDSTVVATDFHPDVLQNLARNVEYNCAQRQPAVNVEKFDWETPHFSSPFDSTFDVILAADVIYQVNHARWIKASVERLLTRPSVRAEGGIFWLVIPIRSTGRHEGMHLMVNQAFSETASMEEANLAILDEINLERHGNFGRADEDGYKLFKIGWARD